MPRWAPQRGGGALQLALLYVHCPLHRPLLGLVLHYVSLHLQALRALGSLLDFTPKVAALLAARPAVAPLLSCLDPICRQAYT